MKVIGISTQGNYICILTASEVEYLREVLSDMKSSPGTRAQAGSLHGIVVVPESAGPPEDIHEAIAAPALKRDKVGATQPKSTKPASAKRRRSKPTQAKTSFDGTPETVRRAPPMPMPPKQTHSSTVEEKPRSDYVADVEPWRKEFLRRLDALGLGKRITNAVARYAYDRPNRFCGVDGQLMDFDAWAGAVVDGKWTNERLNGVGWPELAAVLRQRN